MFSSENPLQNKVIDASYLEVRLSNWILYFESHFQIASKQILILRLWNEDDQTEVKVKKINGRRLCDNVICEAPRALCSEFYSINCKPSS